MYVGESKKAHDHHLSLLLLLLLAKGNKSPTGCAKPYPS
jgi:hypothetical protein